MATAYFLYDLGSRAIIKVDLDPAFMERARVTIPLSVDAPLGSTERIGIDISPLCVGAALVLRLERLNGRLYANEVGDLFIVHDPNHPAEMTVIIGGQKQVLRLLDEDTIKRLVFSE